MKNTKINAQSTDVYKTVRKIRVEEDSTLPDYCSDIMRVIKLEATPVISEKKTYMRDDTLYCDVSGSVCFNVIYLADNAGAESHSFTVDFSDSSRVEASNADPDSVYAFVTPTFEAPVCKVQSPRRVTVKGELALGINAKANVGFECYCPEDTDSTETVSEEVSAERIVTSKDAEFKVSEEIKLPKSCPEMERILSVQLTVSPEEAKCSDNSVSFWGNAGISCIYIPESDGESGAQLQSFYQPLEIKGSFETDDSRGDMIALVSLVPSKPEYEIAPDSLGENRVLKIDFAYTAQCLVKENTSFELTKDIYGVGCEVEPEYDKCEMKKYIGTLRESTAVKEKIPLKKGINALEGAGATVSLKDIYFENGELYANCRADVNAIGITPEGECSFSESFDVSLHLNLPSEVSGESDRLSFDIQSSAGYVDTKLDDGFVNVIFDITTLAHISLGDECIYVSSADITESEKKREGTVFYYPTDSDTLWTVGKRYSVSQKALAEENGIGESKELKRVMLIP